ncbi:hypothetical protein CDD81_1921 [Ophiocordyceps australis]|uniref:Copper acquisition factor BIM1-like domain-containing protein n=1 Tax=Ophiocordyceps australis TaxID=1399860 RepID=A0A2C5Y021_9HYPO|nr:hypothetical protein CDD81_1921 [Ophiocordyceps australis]
MGARIVSQQMGPAKFMWPKSRGWSAATDNMGPCGSVTGVVNRTEFPLQNGKIALVAQSASWDVQVGVSYLQEPLADSDFSTLVAPQALHELDMGHTCIPVADAPPTVKAGRNATLQIKYTSEFDNPQRQVFYACADITYVDLVDFRASVPCFNATRKEGEEEKGVGSSHAHGEAFTASKSSAKLSKSAIAGIVVGSCAAVSMLLAVGLMVYRKRERRLRVERQQTTARGVKWEDKEVKQVDAGQV